MVALSQTEHKMFRTNYRFAERDQLPGFLCVPARVQHMPRNTGRMFRSSSPLVEGESDTDEDEHVSYRSTWSLTVHSSGALDVSNVSSLSADVTFGGHGRRQRRAGCAAVGLFPGTHNRSVVRFMACAVLKHIEHGSSLDASRHGREWPVTHPVSCRARALRVCGDSLRRCGPPRLYWFLPLLATLAHLVTAVITKSQVLI